VDIRAMKIHVLMGLLLLGFGGSALAASKESCDRRIQNMIAKLEVLQDKKEKAIPAEQLRKAQGIILIDRTKAGIVFAYQGGRGVALVRNEKTHKWGPAVFVSGSEASLGLLGGGEETFYAILLMNRDSFRMVKDSNFEFGGKVRGTAGQSSAGAKGTTSSADPVVLQYEDASGFYGGAEVSGDSINPDDGANKAYYGPDITVKDILAGEKVKPSDATKELIKKLDEYAKK
jgi:lipid-binding SYLF domain-containing protein